MRTRRRLGTITAVTAATLGLAILAAPLANANASVTLTNQTVEVTDFPVALGSCVNFGSGELILISGTLHTVTALRSDAVGGFHVTLHANLANMTAAGASSGDSYRVTDTAGGFGSRTNAYLPPGSASPRTLTESRDIRFISTGSADNLLIRNTYHLTINANGDVTVDDPTFEQICVG